MAKDISISIRLDSGLKEQTESILDQFGLNMTVAVNMFFRQIVRGQAVPLSLTLRPRPSVMAELELAKAERMAGYIGRSANQVADNMERTIAEAEHGAKIASK